MKNITFSLIVGILLISFVAGADLLVSQFTDSKTIDKVQRDFILEQIPTPTKGEKVVDVKIDIYCSDKDCKFDYNLEGVKAETGIFMNKFHCVDNKDLKTINRRYTKKELNCELVEYTKEELQAFASDIVSRRLRSYANGEMNKETTNYIKTVEGNLVIGERK